MDIATPRPRGDSFHSPHPSVDFGTSSILLKEVYEPDDRSSAVPNPDYHDSWEPEVAARILREKDKATRGQRPYMVALVGIPGSGKSVCSFL